MKKDIIILTKSYKHQDGFCVAGIDATTGEWIRMISSNKAKEGAVPSEAITYSNGNMIDIFDVLRIDFIKSCNSSVQPENWFYNENVGWQYLRKSNLTEVLRLHPYDSPQYIFQNTEKSLPANTAFHGDPSLLFIKVLQPRIVIKTFEKKKIQYSFEYNNYQYNFFSITDPSMLAKYNDFSDGTYHLSNNSDVVFSLTDKYDYNGKYYKVVAQFL